MFRLQGVRGFTSVGISVDFSSSSNSRIIGVVCSAVIVSSVVVGGAPRAAVDEALFDRTVNTIKSDTFLQSF